MATKAQLEAQVLKLAQALLDVSKQRDELERERAMLACALGERICPTCERSIAKELAAKTTTETLQ